MTSVSAHVKCPSDGNAAAPQQQQIHEEEKPRIDPFFYYSDDQRRMNKILLKDKDNNFDMVTLQSYVDAYMVAQQQGASKRRRSNSSKSIKQGERKTRLSFEAHPRLMLLDSSDESDNNNEDDDSYQDITGRSRVSLEDPKTKVE